MTLILEQIIKSRDKAFLDNLQKAIEHHRTAPDPHGIANAVICALSEVQAAYLKAVDDNPIMPSDDKLPTLEEIREIYKLYK